MKSVKDILSIIKDGDRRHGVELLYNLHYNKMYAIAYIVTQNHEMSENVVHDVVYQLLTVEDEFFPSDNEATWLYSVVKNSALNVMKRENIYADYALLDDIAIEDRHITDFVDLDEFNSMLHGLKEEQKRVVTLKVLGGYTHKEIGVIMNKPASTIQWIYNTSIKKLRALLAGFIPCIVILAVGLFVSIGYHIKDQLKVTAAPGGANKLFTVDGIYIILAVLVLFIIIFVIFLKKFSKTPTKRRL